MMLWKRIRALLDVARNRKQEIQLASQAEIWLRDEAFNHVLAHMRAETIEQWYKSRDPETRERAWQMMWTIDLFVDKLRGLIANEQIQQDQEERQDARAQRERSTQEGA